mgnify:FL=1
MNTAELSRLLANLIKQGTIAESDPAAGRVRVLHGGLTTDWLPYFVPAAGGVSVHRPPSVGENCIVLSPSGEPANGVVLCGMASDQFPQPGQSADETVVKFPDGAVSKYNHAASKLNISGINTANIQAASLTTVDCPQSTFTGAVTVQGLFTYQAGMAGSNGATGSTTIEGDFKHKGSFENTGKVSSNGVVLDNHVHSGVLAGGADTGGPK